MFGPIYKKYRERIERKRERKRQLNIVGIKNHRSAAVRGGRRRARLPGSAVQGVFGPKLSLYVLKGIHGAVLCIKYPAGAQDIRRGLH